MCMDFHHGSTNLHSHEQCICLHLSSHHHLHLYLVVFLMVPFCLS
jgi:hypothetical protein